MVGINGPPLESSNADKYIMGQKSDTSRTLHYIVRELSLFRPTLYVISWLKAGHHDTLDKATGLSKVATVVKPSAKLSM